jgi:hypothetical protein
MGGQSGERPVRREAPAADNMLAARRALLIAVAANSIRNQQAQRLHSRQAWGKKWCLNGMAENVVGSGRDARGRTTVLPKALAERRWRPGQSGNPAGHTGEYGEVMKIARSYAPAAMHRLAELAELNQLDSEGYLVPLSDLPAADRRVIAVLGERNPRSRLRQAEARRGGEGQ